MPKMTFLSSRPPSRDPGFDRKIDGYLLKIKFINAANSWIPACAGMTNEKRKNI
jgi:hypothetical protein